MTPQLIVGKPETLRHIKATITEDEYGAMHWAAKRSGGRNRAVTLAEFMREAIRDKVRSVARYVGNRGGDVPQNVAAVLDTGRVGN